MLNQTSTLELMNYLTVHILASKKDVNIFFSLSFKYSIFRNIFLFSSLTQFSARTLGKWSKHARRFLVQCIPIPGLECISAVGTSITSSCDQIDTAWDAGSTVHITVSVTAITAECGAPRDVGVVL